jgi:hypothetical protein
MGKFLFLKSDLSGFIKEPVKNSLKVSVKKIKKIKKRK